jgi:hypothetical protein
MIPNSFRRLDRLFSLIFLEDIYASRPTACVTGEW